MKFKRVHNGLQDEDGNYIERNELHDLFDVFLDSCGNGEYEIKHIRNISPLIPVKALFALSSKPRILWAKITISNLLKTEAHALSLYKWPTMQYPKVYDCVTHEFGDSEYDANCDLSPTGKCNPYDHREYIHIYGEKFSLDYIIQIFLEEFGGELTKDEINEIVEFMHGDVED